MKVLIIANFKAPTEVPRLDGSRTVETGSMADYEAAKAAYVKADPDATPEHYEAAIAAILTRMEL